MQSHHDILLNYVPKCPSVFIPARTGVVEGISSSGLKRLRSAAADNTDSRKRSKRKRDSKASAPTETVFNSKYDTAATIFLLMKTRGKLRHGRSTIRFENDSSLLHTMLVAVFEKLRPLGHPALNNTETDEALRYLSTRSSFMAHDAKRTKVTHLEADISAWEDTSIVRPASIYLEEQSFWLDLPQGRRAGRETGWNRCNSQESGASDFQIHQDTPDRISQSGSTPAITEIIRRHGLKELKSFLSKEVISLVDLLGVTGGLVELVIGEGGTVTWEVDLNAEAVGYLLQIVKEMLVGECPYVGFGNYKNSLYFQLHPLQRDLIHIAVSDSIPSEGRLVRFNAIEPTWPVSPSLHSYPFTLLTLYIGIACLPYVDRKAYGFDDLAHQEWKRNSKVNAKEKDPEAGPGPSGRRSTRGKAGRSGGGNKSGSGSGVGKSSGPVDAVESPQPNGNKMIGTALSLDMNHQLALIGKSLLIPKHLPQFRFSLLVPSSSDALSWRSAKSAVPPSIKTPQSKHHHLPHVVEDGDADNPHIRKLLNSHTLVEESTTVMDLTAFWPSTKCITPAPKVVKQPSVAMPVPIKVHLSGYVSTGRTYDAFTSQIPTGITSTHVQPNPSIQNCIVKVCSPYSIADRTLLEVREDVTNEADILENTLASMQGKHVPVFHGLWEGWRSLPDQMRERLWLMILEDVGPPVVDDLHGLGDLKEDDKASIVEIVTAIHSCNVIHGDLHPRHFRRFWDGTIRLIDFEGAYILDETDDVTAEKAREMARLRCMLETSEP